MAPGMNREQRRAIARTIGTRPVEPNLLDRMAGAISPKWGARRLMQRQAMALAGGYSGGSRARASMRNWSTTAQDADGDLLPDLPELRQRARDLVRNAPLAGGALSTTVENVVGTGLAVQPSIDAKTLGLTPEAAQAWNDKARAEFNLWAESPYADVARKLNFYGLQTLAFRSAWENGDVLALQVDKQAPGHPYTLAIQLVEADRLCNPNQRADTDAMLGGVELDRDGAHVAYQVASRHPGQLSRGGAGLEWTRVPVQRSSTGRVNAVLLAEQLRVGQTRGVPMLAPVIEPLKQLSRFTEAELQAAVVAGMFAVFVKMEPEAFEDLFSDDGRARYLESASSWDGTVTGAGVEGPGKAVNLLPGESLESANPGRPNPEFDPFFQAIVRQVAVGLRLPFEILIKHYTASYSAARAAMLDAWRFFRGRRDWLATHFCQWIYGAVIEEAVAAGRLAAPGFFRDARIRQAYLAAQWIGDGPGSIDPVKDVTAAKERVALGISNRAIESVLHDGIPWEPKHQQLVREEAMRREAGLDVAPGDPNAAADAPDGNGDVGDGEGPGNDGSGGGQGPKPAPARPGSRPAAPARQGGAPARQGGAEAAVLALVADLQRQNAQVLNGVLDLVAGLARSMADGAVVRDAATTESMAAQVESLRELAGAIAAHVAEPVDVRVAIEQADVHLHQHAAPSRPRAVEKTVLERDPDGNILRVIERDAGPAAAARDVLQGGA